MIVSGPSAFRSHGYLRQLVRDKVVEADTQHCKHCCGLVLIGPGIYSGAWCLKCGGPVCSEPACLQECRPWGRQAEEQHARDRLALARGLLVG